MAELNEDEITALRAEAQRAGQLEAELASLREASGVALRAVVVAAHPELPADLIVGGTVQELQASVTRASGLVETIRERTLEEVRNMAAGKPPLGFRPPTPAGGRAPVDLSNMTAAQKIRNGLDALPKPGG